MSNNHCNNLFKKRSRSGCWTCRKRHQKCDEQKPSCLNCRLRGVECGGYGIILTEFTAHSNRRGQMVSKIQRNRSAGHDTNRVSSSPEPSPVVAPENVEDGETPERCFQIAEDDNALMNLETEVEEGIEWLMTEMHNTPFNGVPSPAVNEAAHGLVSDGGESSVDMATLDPSLLCLHEFSIPPTPQDPFDQYLFTYYMDTLSFRLYPVKTDQNPYRRIYGALAKESEPLLKSIMLASALHLSKQGRPPKFAIKPYRLAVQESFREALTTQNDAWSLGLTVLLSIVFDIIGTGLDTWSSKLIGCRRLLELAVSAPRANQCAGLQCVLLQYNWAVTMSKTLVRGIVPDEVFNELTCIDELPAACGITEGLEMASHQSQWWDNLPDYQMHLFLREATEYSLLITRLDTTYQTDKILRLMPHVADLVDRIKEWHPETSKVQTELADSIQHFNCIWKIGMLCFVYSEIYALGPSDDLIKDLVEASIEPLRRLSWLQACLFPVSMIALQARTEEARSSFEEKLNQMHRVLGFQGPLSVISILRQIWQQSNGTLEGKLRWREIIKGLDAEINILL